MIATEKLYASSIQTLFVRNKQHKGRFPLMNPADHRTFSHMPTGEIELEGVDLYFTKSRRDALYKYSHKWDVPINNYLRQGDQYFQSTEFLQMSDQYTRLEEANADAQTDDPVENIKRAVDRIDELFLSDADVLQQSTSVWRGMKTRYPGLAHPGDSVVIRNFVSTTLDRDQARSFARANRSCCLYRLTVSPGVPYIDMKITTRYLQEKEILFPRNLKFTLRESGGEYEDVLVEPSYDGQFSRHTGCIVKWKGRLLPSTKLPEILQMLSESPKPAKAKAAAAAKPAKAKAAAAAKPAKAKAAAAGNTTENNAIHKKRAKSVKIEVIDLTQ
jgi:hypothetical protein